MQKTTKYSQMFILQTISVPTNQPIRLCSEFSAQKLFFVDHEEKNKQGSNFDEKQTGDSFNNHQKKPNMHSKKICDLYLYTNTAVYFGELFSQNLNRQLNWDRNTRFLNTLKQCLSGKNANAVVSFIPSPFNPKLVISCDFQQKSLRIMFFQLNLVCLEQPPYSHAQKLMKIANQKIGKRITQLQISENMLINQIQKTQSLKAQIKDMYDFEINHMQNSYLPIINQIKQKTRIFFNEDGKQVIQIERQQGDDSTHSRKFLKINKNPSVDKRQSQNFQKLFEK